MQYKKTSALLLAGYVAGMTASRANPMDLTPESVDTLTTFGTAAAFLGLCGILFWCEKVGDFPNVAPFALVMALTYLVVPFFFKGIRKIANIVGISAFVATALTVILSKRNSLDIALVVLMALPLVLAMPSLFSRKSVVPESITHNALTTSRLVYDRTKNENFEEAEFVSDAGTGASVGVYVTKSQEIRDIYVAFAGTESKAGWLKTDIKAVNAGYPYAKDAGQVHRGFLEAWESIREETWAKISDVILRNAGSGNIILCGHSLGGALSTIAAGDLINRLESQFLDRLFVVTFGSPVVGTQAFADWYNSAVQKSLRVAAVFDPVPKTPISNFVHVDTLYAVTTSTATPANAHNFASYEKALRGNTDYAIAIPVAILGGLFWFLYSS